MKNSLPILLLSVIVVFIISSCKKNVETCRLGRYYVTDGNTTQAPSVFSYYESERLKTISYSDRSKDTLHYVADTFFLNRYNYYDTLLMTFTGIMNSSSYLVDGVKTTFDNTGNLVSTDNYSNEYNANGNLTKQIISNSNGTTLTSITYLAGDATDAEVYNGSQLDGQYLFFRSKAENKTGIDDLNSFFAPYFGKPSSHLLDSMYIIFSTDTTRVQYAHTLDENGYVLKTIQTFLNPVGVQTKYHTYQYFGCN